MIFSIIISFGWGYSSFPILIESLEDIPVEMKDIIYTHNLPDYLWC